MSVKSPKAIAFRIALIIAISGVITFVLLDLYGESLGTNIKAFILFVLILAGNYVAVSFSLEKFLLNKVKLIYKSINNFKRGTKNGQIDLNISDDALSEVNKDVQAWSKDKLGKIEQLQNQETFRKEFIGNLSHELKTPVFSIQGYILTLLDGALNDPKHNESFLVKAAKSVDRITALLNDLDSINNLEEGKLPLDKSEFDIVALTKEVFEMLEATAEESSIELRLKVSNQKPEFVSADKDKITQVLTNLVLNSIKYGSEKGYTELRFYDMDDNILIEVKDNGLGIEEEHLPRLFERFYRVDKSRSRHIGGTGLGLAIVKHILEAHGHEISVRSKLGSGSTFTFSLTKV